MSENNHHHHDHHHPHSHGHSHEHDNDDHSGEHEMRTRWVVYLTACTMVVEIFFGYWTNSMALLADGYHMASHVFALGLSWAAYIIARRYSNSSKFSFSKNMLLALSGYTSAIVLFVIAVLMAEQSTERFFNPVTIKFEEAIFVAAIGLIVNALSAFFLHHGHEHHDHNIRSAYLHVLADGLTSVTAIIALTAGMFYNLYSLDSISGIISSVVITKWSYGLIKGSGKELVNFKSK
ncbi:MAG: cation diffusion facilitator family transporter [Ignavibacteria bacterium]|nr:cation diffusion facilitator family transporter [Ignavibacteria bacterium]